MCYYYELATTRQVAKFYDVSVQVIYNTLHDHKEEVESDGYKVVESKELLLEIDTPFSKKGLLVVKGRGGYYLDGKMVLSYSKTGVFTKRAILRVGMLLRDSKVAQEIRSQLLNVVENSSDEVKTM